MRTATSEQRAAAHSAAADSSVRRDLSAQAHSERSTRARVARLILELGPSTASVIGSRLGLTPAAIRRHLDNLLAEGLIETRTARTYASRGRGRPARLFAITDAGRSAFEHAYDDLASSALRFLATTAGPAAVEEFARHQVAELERRYGPAVTAAPPGERVQALADALSADGYAASTVAAPAAEKAGGRLGRRAAVPASLPGGARGRRVPAAVRGRDRGVQPAAGRPGASAGHHRPRRRHLHHPRDLPLADERR